MVGSIFILQEKIREKKEEYIEVDLGVFIFEKKIFSKQYELAKI